jgi:hypothetical protein
MKTILQKTACSLSVLSAMLLGANPAQGAPLLVSNFEVPTYTSNTALGGQAGWTGAGRVTPDSSGYTFALAGSQSAFVGVDGTARKYFSSVGATAADMYELSWLQGTPDAVGLTAYQGLYLINASNQTPAGITAKNVGGTVNIWLSGNTEVDTGVTYAAGGGGAPTVTNIYQFTMQFDFASDQMTGFYKLGAGPTTSLGSVAISNTLTAADVAANYGVYLNSSSGTVGFDNIQLTAVPEPSTMAMALLGLGILSFARRSRRKSASA